MRFTEEERALLGKVLGRVEHYEKINYLARITEGYGRSTVHGFTDESTDAVFADILEAHARYLRSELTPEQIEGLDKSCDAFCLSMSALLKTFEKQ